MYGGRAAHPAGIAFRCGIAFVFATLLSTLASPALCIILCVSYKHHAPPLPLSLLTLLPFPFRSPQLQMKVLIAFVAILAVAAASCPNKCSGHGTCGGSDKCACWPNWQGSDCSDRTCKFDIAWASDHWYDAHYYAECSGKGLCDRETGECVCFEGYTGAGCKRSVCPNDCSGHGKCRLVNELANANLATTYTGWDSDKIQACVCDGGFYGPDCSQRYCPKGDDPLTICDEDVENNNGAEITSTFQQQRISFRFGPFGALPDAGSGPTVAAANLENTRLQASEMAFKWVDNQGESWWTNTISGLFAPTALNTAADVYATYDGAAIETALEALPNFKVPAVSAVYSAEVSQISGSAVEAAAATLSSGGFISYLVTFDGGDSSDGTGTGTTDSSRVSGNQQLIQCDFPLGCMTAGCQPMYAQPRIEVSSSAADVALTTDSVFTQYYPENYATEAVAAVNTVAGSPYDARITVTVVADAGDATEDGGAALLFPGASEIANYYTVEIDYLDADLVVANEVLVAQQRIPEQFAHVDIGYGLALTFGSRTTAAAEYTIDIGIPRCEVSQETAAHPEREDMQCSGRGTCDSASGVCSCFEGFYGDHCALQTILV